MYQLQNGNKLQIQHPIAKKTQTFDCTWFDATADKLLLVQVTYDRKKQPIKCYLLIILL
jgi:hypothetical protein